MKDFKPRRGAHLVSDTDGCEDSIDDLLAGLRAMPSSTGGVAALRLSSRLLEFAAFELAPELGSQRTSALILAAADLAQEAECSAQKTHAGTRQKIALVH